MLTIWCAGLMTGLALILAIGAQNALVLRQGVRSEHVGVVVTLCITSDVLLITGGTLGIGALVSQFPVGLAALRWAGAGYLLWWAIRSFAASLKTPFLTLDTAKSKRSVVLTTLAVTYLNPHVYLDTVVLLGSLANQHSGDARWAFAAGAVVSSVLWFTALGYGARALSGVLQKPGTWRTIDMASGTVMLFVAIKLVLGSPA
jgi:L-lysine exporter family protein LysE/ArgO